MKSSKIYVFSSPKTLGCTTFALNLAWEDQKRNPDKNIFLFQSTRYPDLQHHLGFNPENHLATLIPFYHEGALDLKALQSISPTKTLTILPSAPFEYWDFLDLDFWDALWKIIRENFDRIYIDLHLSTPELFMTRILQSSHHFFSLETLEPSCQEKAAVFRKNNPEIISKTIQIYSQVPSRFSPKAFNPLFPSLGSFPIDEKSVWYEVFTQKLVIDQKRSILGKTIKKILPSLISLD